MGLFSTKKTYVSSVVYNMAGDYEDRQDFTQFMVQSAVMFPSKGGVGEAINQGNMAGPYFRMRRFYNWAKTNFTEGIPSKLKSSNVFVDPAVVEAAITPSAPGRVIWVQTAKLDRTDEQMWAEQWIMQNYPGRMKANWEARINASDVLVIDWRNPDLPNNTVPMPSNWNRRAKYIYARYSELGKTGGLWDYVGRAQMFIYKMGSGNAALDALDDEGPEFAGFYPFIPIRTFNTWTNTGAYATSIYPDIKKAVPKATGGMTYPELRSMVEDNPSIDDIDHACLVFGVPINSKSKSSLRYIYRFFQDQIESQIGTEEGYNGFVSTTYPTYRAYWTAMKSWIADVNAGSGTSDPPPRQSMREAQATRIRLHPTHADTAHMDIELSWKYLKETIFNGAKGTKGAIWIEKKPSVDFDDEYYNVEEYLTRPIKDEVFHIYWQETETQYRQMRVVGLVSRNMIYDNKSITIASDEALDDPDEAGLFIPLVQSVLENIPINHANQVCTECLLMVFNSYTTVKQKWYQTWIFKLVIVAVSIGLAVVTGGTSLGATAGLLGTNAAVGAALGMTGIAAAVAGAAVNAIAGMLLAHLITQGATALFGEKLGAIIGAVAAVVGTMAVAGTFNGGFQWNSLMRADNLLKLTEAGIGGYQRALAIESQNIYGDIQALAESYEERTEEIDRLNRELMGSPNALNPLLLTDSAIIPFEKPETFLERTLLTGSDIAEITQDMISEFTTQTLGLPLME